MVRRERCVLETQDSLFSHCQEGPDRLREAVLYIVYVAAAATSAKAPAHPSITDFAQKKKPTHTHPSTPNVPTPAVTCVLPA